MGTIRRKHDYLYVKLKNYLYELILANKTDRDYRLPTELSLAETFDISRITIRKAFEELENEGMIFRVQGKGSYINFAADFSQIPLHTTAAEDFSSAKKIGVVLPYNRGHASEILEYISRYCNTLNDENLVLLFGVSEQSQSVEEKIIQSMLKQNISGLMIYPVDAEKYSKLLLKLTLDGFPVVLLDRYIPGQDINSITSDNLNVTYTATKKLIEKGHRNIIILSANPDQPTTVQERIKGYEQALMENDIMLLNSYRVIARSSADDNESLTRRLIQIINTQPATAILPICYSSSVILQNSLKFLDQKRLAELSMYNFEFTTDFKSRLSILGARISQQPAIMGEEAVRLLLKNIAGRKDFKTQNIQIPCVFSEEDRIKDIRG